MISESENWNQLRKVSFEIIERSVSKVVVLIDGDRTLAPTDTTKIFFKNLAIDFQQLKEIFKEFGYSFEAFLNVSKFYTKIPPRQYATGCLETARQVKLSPEILKMISNINDRVEIVVITAGIRLLWHHILLEHGIRDKVTLIGGNHFHFESYLVDKIGKGEVVNFFKRQGYRVVALGDSLVDYDMLMQADAGYLVVNERLNKDIVPFLDGISHISQISFGEYLYSGLRAVSIQEVTDSILDYVQNESI